jgi:sugar fermentation stimulation protein A
MNWFGPVEEAFFQNRPNRFVVRCLHKGKDIEAFLPNPGRLQELFLPGVRLFLTRQKATPERRFTFTVAAVEREGRPIMLHTHQTNAVAAYLLEEGRIPGLEGIRIIGKEIPVHHSRFDLLLARDGEEILTEVKSCTLVGKAMAMFPDAVTERGSRHLRELSSLSRKGRSALVLFIVHWPKVDFFLPDYHTDLIFARTMLECRETLRFLPVAVEWKKDLALGRTVKPLAIPWDLLEQEAQDRGSYVLILRVKETRKITVGKLGRITFPPGYYLYVGSAMGNLTARTERHRRLLKTKHWHIDYLRAEAEFKAVLPIRSSVPLECLLAQRTARIAEWSIPGFGCSDCRCPSHLLGFSTNPLQLRVFLDLIQYFRMDRLSDSLKMVSGKQYLKGIE